MNYELFNRGKEVVINFLDFNQVEIEFYIGYLNYYILTKKNGN